MQTIIFRRVTPPQSSGNQIDGQIVFGLFTDTQQLTHNIPVTTGNKYNVFLNVLCASVVNIPIN